MTQVFLGDAIVSIQQGAQRDMQTQKVFILFILFRSIKQKKKTTMEEIKINDVNHLI